jgi:hypothetical protein
LYGCFICSFAWRHAEHPQYALLSLLLLLLLLLLPPPLFPLSPAGMLRSSTQAW